MGLGDELMAAGHAQRLYDADPAKGPVAICDHLGRARSHDLWRHNDAIAPRADGYPLLVAPGTRTIRNAKFCRPYIQYPFTDQTGWKWATKWKARDHRGRLFLSDTDEGLGLGLQVTFGRYLLIEPSPVRGNKNRYYPIAQWQAVADLLREAGLIVLQGKHGASRLLTGVTHIAHRSFREACGLLKYAGLFLGTEGGLAHAASMTGTPSVVLWGGCISEPVLGYPEHLNLVDDSPETPCGTWAPCPHCEAAWARLSPQMVVDAVLAHWQKGS